MPYALSPEDFFLSLELGFSKGDSSIYDPNTLRNNATFQKYGLGSIIQLFQKPTPFKQPNVPTVEGTLLLENIIVSYLVSGNYMLSVSTYIIKDKNLWVIIPSSSSKNGQRISQSEALKKYKSDGKHFGKFAIEKNAQAYKTALESNFAKNLEKKSLSEVSQFGPYVTSLNLSYSIDGANQIQFTVIDKDYLMMENNLFLARRKLLYRGTMYEIGVVEVGQGPASSPQVTVTAWDAAVQAMKRDKKPDSISGSSAYEYAVNAAKKFGIELIAEKTNKTQTINKGNGTNSDQSVWSVLQSAANQDEFVLYVMDGVMVYGSQKWLLWKYGADSKSTYNTKTKVTTTKKYSRLYYNPGGTIPADAQKFTVMEYPTIRQSENDPLEGDGRIVVAKPNGCLIKPGMTVIIGPKPTLFQGGYIVTEVSFSEGTNDPVEISFRTPEKPVNQEDKP